MTEQRSKAAADPLSSPQTVIDLAPRAAWLTVLAATAANHQYFHSSISALW